MKKEISYHPISEKEIRDWYMDMDFSVIANNGNYNLIRIARLSNMDDMHLKEYINTMKFASGVENSATFDTSHGFYIAKIQTYFRESFAVKASFSEFIDEKPGYKEGYTKTWEKILLNETSFQFLNKLSDVPSSGVYIPNEKVIDLLNDYQKNLIVKGDIDGFFGRNIKSFIKALEYAKEHECGLLEANEILKTESIAIIKHAEQKKKTQAGDISKVEKNVNSSEGTRLVDNSGDIFDGEESRREKKSMFGSLFGKK